MLVSHASRILAMLPPVRRDIELVSQKMNSFLSSPAFHSEVSSCIFEAIIIAEDRRFRNHQGVDGFAVIRAAVQYILNGRISGASTIEQQLVRTWRSRYELSIRRKVSEIAIACTLSARYSKNEIVSAYAHCAYFGWHASGIDAVSKRLNIDIQSASPSDAATIAAMLKLPMPRFPTRKYSERLAIRKNYILLNMSRYGGKHAKDF